MKRSFALGVCLLAACAYQPLRFGLWAEGVDQARQVVADGEPHRLLVRALEASASVRPESVTWEFTGAVEPGPQPGTFIARRAGDGQVRATFMAGDRQTLIATIRAVAVATPQPSPTTPPPAPQPTATPRTEPTPAPPSSDERAVLEAYRFAEAGDHLGAAARLLTVSGREWLPKAQALLEDWSEMAGDEGILRTRQALAAGQDQGAREILVVVHRLKLTLPQRRLEESLWIKLGERPPLR